MGISNSGTGHTSIGIDKSSDETKIRCGHKQYDRREHTGSICREIFTNLCIFENCSNDFPEVFNSSTSAKKDHFLRILVSSEK